MKKLDTTHTTFNADEAVKVAAELNADEFDDWTYVVRPNPNPNGRKTAVIDVFDEDGEFVSVY